MGDGVGTSNLGGRTLADLITGTASDLVTLPWVNHRSKPWEPEPFRWLGTNVGLRVMTSADDKEARTGRPSRRAAHVRAQDRPLVFAPPAAMGGLVEVKELGHLVLYVRDIGTSARFYRDVLGWRQIMGDDLSGMPVAAFASPSLRTHHELLLIEVGADATAIPPGRRIGMYHFGLKVGDSDDELRDAVRTLQENGIPILGASDHTVTHSLYIADPDGNEIELYIDVPGVDWRNDPSLVAAPVRPLRL